MGEPCHVLIADFSDGHRHCSKMCNFLKARGLHVSCCDGLDEAASLAKVVSPDARAIEAASHHPTLIRSCAEKICCNRVKYFCVLRPTHQCAIGEKEDVRGRNKTAAMTRMVLLRKDLELLGTAARTVGTHSGAALGSTEG